MSRIVIPVILIQDSLETDLKEKLIASSVVKLLRIIETRDREEITQLSRSAPEAMIVINANDVDTRAAIKTSLDLRNAGHHVFVTTADDYPDLIEILTDIHGFLDGIDEDEIVKTEIMITDQALQLLGDVTAIVKEYEYVLARRN